jgi:signal transduction histidine kinase
MSAGEAHLLAAALLFVPALVWSVVARQYWLLARTRSPLRFLALLFLVPAGLLAILLVLGVLTQLVWTHLRGPENHLRTVLLTIGDVTAVALLPFFHHAALYASFRATPAGRHWLATNYGAAVVVAGLVVLVHAGVVPSRDRVVSWLVIAYAVGMLVLIGRSFRRHARRGVWRPGGIGEPHRLDVVMIACGTLALTAVFLVGVGGGAGDRPMLSASGHRLVWIAGLQAATALAFAVPAVVRMLGTAIAHLLMAIAVLGSTAAVYFGTRALGGRIADVELRRLVELAGVLGLIVVLVPGRAWLRGAVDRLVFRRARRREGELQAFLQTLSPELGIVECCRRTLEELVRVMQLRGAAILLRGGETVVQGSLAVDPLVRAWPRGAAMDTLPRRAFIGEELGGDARGLIEALIEADVMAVQPIVSPRQRWGDLFLHASLVGATLVNLEEVETFQSFADQLARVLDGADLLARAVAVERSLAHAEKLAAIGETAARIAHDIRNPVTAARSLAQQLARGGTADAEAAGLILAELERVERQVGSLLRFARREELRCEPVELGALVRATAEALRPRLGQAGIAVVLDTPAEVVARADREKLRQVLINLIENAIDALAGHAGPRRLALAVGLADGAARVRVVDTGPGVPADALPRLFEPFFSLKEQGTGLGLAIARRTIEAHGGRIRAASRPGHTTFEIELPAVDG